jgi:hypothetical protein
MLKKGQTANPNGRPQGTQNKATGAIRAAFQQLIENNLQQLESDLSDLEPKDRISMLIKISEFVLPKLQSIDISTQLELEYKHLESLLMKGTPEAIETISNKIIQLSENNSNNN